MARKNGAAAAASQDDVLTIVGGDPLDEDIVELADAVSEMLPVIRKKDGTLLYGYVWDKRRPLSAEARVGAIIRSLGPATMIEAVDEWNRPRKDEQGEPILYLGWEQGAYFKAIARILCEIIPGLEMEEADWLNEAERTRILTKVGYLKRPEEREEPDAGKAPTTPPSTGEREPVASPTSTT